MTNKDIVNRYLVELNLKCCIGPLGRKINVTGRRRHHLRTKIHAQKNAPFSPYSPQSIRGVRCLFGLWNSSCLKISYLQPIWRVYYKKRKSIDAFNYPVAGRCLQNKLASHNSRVPEYADIRFLNLDWIIFPCSSLQEGIY
jgi:hypothetical protein